MHLATLIVTLEKEKNAVNSGHKVSSQHTQAPWTNLGW